MYNAPAVSYPVGRSRFQVVFASAVVLAGAVALGAWALLSLAYGVGHVLGLLIWLLTSGWTIWVLIHTPEAQLVWEGQDWRWCSGAITLLAVPQVILDVQHSLLICLRLKSGGVLWVWPSQKSQPGRWLALRRALFNPTADRVEPDSSRLTTSPEA